MAGLNGSINLRILIKDQKYIDKMNTKECRKRIQMEFVLKKSLLLKLFNNENLIFITAVVGLNHMQAGVTGEGGWV